MRYLFSITILLMFPVLLINLADLSFCLAEELINKDQFAEVYYHGPEVLAELQCSKLGMALEHAVPQDIKLNKCSESKLAKMSAEIIRELSYVAKDPLIYDNFIEAFGDMSETELYSLMTFIEPAKAEKERLQAKNCGLTAMELLCIKSYTGHFFRRVNAVLRSEQKADIEKFSNYIRILNSGLDKLADYKGTVRRGTTLPQKVAANYQEGSVITEKGYLSTSINNSFFGDHLFIIKSNHCKFIGPISYLKSENEVLCKPQTTLKIINKFENILGGIDGFVLEEMD